LSRSAFESFSFLLFKDQNTTLLWFAVQKEVNASLTEKLIDVQQQIMELDQKVVGTRAQLSSHGKVKNRMTVMVAVVVAQVRVMPVVVVTVVIGVVLLVVLVSGQFPQ